MNPWLLASGTACPSCGGHRGSESAMEGHAGALARSLCLLKKLDFLFKLSGGGFGKMSGWLENYTAQQTEQPFPLPQPQICCVLRCSAQLSKSGVTFRLSQSTHPELPPDFRSPTRSSAPSCWPCQALCTPQASVLSPISRPPAMIRMAPRIPITPTRSVSASKQHP